MSRSKLEKVLELLINEDREGAEELLHDFIVENARQIHEELLSESDEVVEEDLEDLDESEEELTNELESDEAEIEAEEFYDEDGMEDEDSVEDEMEFDAEDDGMEDEGDVESRVDDLESALAELEAEFEKIMNGDDADEEGAEELEMDDEDEYEDEMEESFDLDLDLEESEELEEEDESELVEYVTPVSASTGDNGVQNKSTVNANPKRPGDESNAAPIKTHDGDTAGGKGTVPQNMSTKNVNVSGNKKAPTMSNQTAKTGDNGLNTKSIS